MHQPVAVPDLDRRPVPTVSLQTGDRWIAVPAWWAAEHIYRHGDSVRPADIPAARAAAVHAKLALRQIRSKTMDTRIPAEALLTPEQFAEIEEATASGGEIPGWLALDAPEQAAAARDAGGVVFWIAVAAVIAGVIAAAWGASG